MTKLATVRAAMIAGDWRKALSVASKFSRLGRQKAAIMRAQSALLSPAFYAQLGFAADAVLEAGKAALRERFGATN